MSTIDAASRRGLRVGELAEATGLSGATIRYYERVGLLPEPERTPAGYRRYPVDAVERVSFIRACRRLGMRLADIADLLDIRDSGVCACEPAEHVLRRRMAELDAQIASLLQLRDQVGAMAAALPSATCPPPAPGTTWCPPDRKGGE
jgi:DNA-binding transcriptional MerR regulator